jgi:hypothetical protein
MTVPARAYTREDLDSFVQGWWTQGEDVRFLIWEELEPGEALGPADWEVKPADCILLSYLGDVGNPWYLDESPFGAGPPIVPPTTPIWASLSLLHTKFYWAIIIDYRHRTRWYRPLPAWTRVTLSGSILDVYEKRDKKFVTWSTVCALKSSTHQDEIRFFEVEQTLIPGDVSA